MKKGVKGLILSIMVAVSMIVISIPFWNFGNSSKLNILAMGNTDLPVAYKIGTFDSLTVMDNEVAESLIAPTELVLKNRNGFEKQAKIIMLIEKRSTIPYEYVCVSINDEIFNLKDLIKEEDDDNYYFYVKDVSLDLYEEKKFDTRIWLSKNINEISSSSRLITNIIVR